jgi:hypothetical protein
MVAFAVSLLLLVVMVAGAVRYGTRRPSGASLSWGEAMMAATYVFLVMFFAYGVVPHQWLAWADNELNWRADKIVFGPADLLDKLPYTLTYQVLRDSIAAAIYIVGLGAQIALWKFWQDRGRATPTPAIATSSYGRPLVKRD